MNKLHLTSEISTSRKYFERLSELAGQDSLVLQNELLREAFAELNTTIEELQVADEELRQQNEELIASRHKLETERFKYQELFEFAPSGYIVTDSNGIIQEANRAAVILFGLDRRYLIGKPLANYVLEAERSDFRQAVSDLSEKDCLTERTVTIKPRRGNPFTSAYIAFATRRPGEGVTMRWMINDITERTRIAEKLLSLRSNYEEERDIAERFQRSLMQDIPQDAFPGLAIATHYEAALDEAQAGGDFYDAFNLPSGKVALVIGDVSGKGLKAALYTSQVKSILRAYLGENNSPLSTITRLNRYVNDAQANGDWSADTFVALILAILDPATGQTAFVSAGIDAPLVMRANKSIEQVVSKGMLLGVHNQSVYELASVTLAPGDGILLVTDGIIEAQQGRNMLGREGLEVLAEESLIFDDVDERRKYILNGVRSFMGISSFRDDICILIASRLP